MLAVLEQLKLVTAAFAFAVATMWLAFLVTSYRNHREGARRVHRDQR